MPNANNIIYTNDTIRVDEVEQKTLNIKSWRAYAKEDIMKDIKEIAKKQIEQILGKEFFDKNGCLTNSEVEAISFTSIFNNYKKENNSFYNRFIKNQTIKDWFVSYNKIDN